MERRMPDAPFLRRHAIRGKRMAIPWLAVLKAVPWTEVISNAPKVANGAKKLWDSIGHKPVDSPPEASATTINPTLGGLDAEIRRQRAALAELQGQMQSSSEVIASLAEQNAQLIARVDENRRQLRRAQWAIALLGALWLVLLYKVLAG
jgi:hypothetical protein